MAYTFNPDTGDIVLPVGDTADIYVSVNYSGLNKTSRVLFGVFDKYTPDKDLIIKQATIENGVAHIRLCNADTRDLATGTYRWQLRIVTGGVTDKEGNIVTDECSDEVISVFKNPPTIKLVKGGAYV